MYNASSKEETRNNLNQFRHPVEIGIIGNSDDASNYFNTGGIIRTAHNFQVRKIFLIDRKGYYKKATMGAHKWENIVEISLNEFIVQNRNRNIISFERRLGLTSKSLYFYEYPEQPILIFGSEKGGVPQEILDISKDVVSIEQYGINYDFNQNVAAGIIMYDWIKKYYDRPQPYHG